MPAKVSIVRCSGYEMAEVRRALREALRPLGGMETFVRSGQNVLLKPNLIHTRNAQRGSCTHASVVRAVAEMVLDAGGRPRVGDSPGFLTARAVAEAAGLADALEPLGVPIVEFEAAREAPHSRSSLFRRLELAQQVIDADVVINLPKLKTHAQMLLTLSVKNMFGAVVGTRKAQWHLRAGRDRDLFARMLVDVYLAARPQLTIMDGVVAMEGDGPTSGRPRTLNMLLASPDGVALDAVVSRLLGLAAEDLPTLQAAADAGETDLGRIDLNGSTIEEFAVADFIWPSSRVDLEYGPGFLRGWLKGVLTPKPRINDAACRRCMVCADACPVDGIRRKGERISIAYRDCIRCFCCQELCPHGAVSVHRGALLSALSRLRIWR